MKAAPTQQKVTLADLSKLEKQYKLPQGLLSAVMTVESGGNPKAVSPKGATGLFQFMPETAKAYGIDPLDPKQSAEGAARMYADLQKQYKGDLPSMLAAYNWGSGNLAKNGLRNAPKETRDYIQKIQKRLPGQPRQSIEGLPQYAEGGNTMSDVVPSNPKPETMNLRMPDGRYIRNVPKTAKRSQVIAIARNMGYNIDDTGNITMPDAAQQQQAPQQPQQPQEPQTQQLPERAAWKDIGSQVLKGATFGFNDEATGAINAGINAAKNLSLENFGQDYQQARDTERAYQQAYEAEHPYISTAAQITGAIPSSIALPVGRIASGAGKVVGFGADALAQGALAGAGEAEGMDDLGRQITTGAGTSLVTAAALKPVQMAAGKAINAAKGAIPEAANAVQQLGEKFGVRTSVGDIGGKRFVKNAEKNSEGIPFFGMGEFREAQQEEAEAAAKGVKDKLKAEVEKMTFKGIKTIQKEAEKGNRGANALLAEIDNAGDDWHRIMQNSGNVRGMRTRLIAKNFYDKVEQLANKAGELPLDKSLAAIKAVKEDIASSPIPDQSLLGEIQKIEQALTRDGVKKDFTYARRLRSDLGHIINDSYKGANAVIGSKGVELLKQLKDAVEVDMNSFAGKSDIPGLKSAWKKADTFYKQQVAPYKDREIAKALSEKHKVDEIYKYWIKVDDGEGRAKKFYDVLDQRGKAAVRYGMVAKAFQNAAKEGDFNPAKFAKYMTDRQKASGVFFKGQDKFEVDGFTNLMRHIERAGKQDGNNVPLYKALTGAATTGTLKTLFTTNKGKKFLLASSSLEPGSKQLQKLLETLPSALGQQAAREVTEQEGEGQPLRITIRPSDRLPEVNLPAVGGQ